MDSSIYVGHDLHKDLSHDIIRLIRDESYVFYGLDFSGFDSTVNREFIARAFNIVEDCLIINDRTTFEFDLGSNGKH